VHAPAGQSDNHSGGWALEITVTNNSGAVFGPDGQIDITEYSAAGTETGYESDYSVSFPIVASGQSQSFYDIGHDFTGSDPASKPATCQVATL
jgi:hypothetical protein